MRCTSASRLHLHPIAVLDLEHLERREVEAEMVGRRHVDDAGGGDEALGLLDLGVDLDRIGAVCALHRLDQDEEAVIGVAAEGRDRLAGGPLLGLPFRARGPGGGGPFSWPCLPATRPVFWGSRSGSFSARSRAAAGSRTPFAASPESS